mgnify:CR=1 FL=1
MVQRLSAEEKVQQITKHLNLCGGAVPLQRPPAERKKQTFKVSEYQSRYIVSSKIEREIFSYRGVGILHELTPEEMEEAFKHHLTERNKRENGVTTGVTPFQRNKVN